MKTLKYVADAAPTIIFVFIVAGYLYGDIVELMKYSLLTVALLVFLLPITEWVMKKVLKTKHTADE